MSRLKRVTTLVAAFAVAGLVASCGTNSTGSEGSSSTTPVESSSSGPAEATSGTAPEAGAEPSPLNLNLAKDDTVAAMLPKAVADAGVLKIATDASYAPNEFLKDGQGEPIGMSIDLGNAMAQVLGVKTEWTNTSFDGILNGLTAGRYDISISSFTDTKKREEQVNFVTYLSAGTSIVVAKGNPEGVKGVEDLCGKSVGAENGTTQFDMLTSADVDDSVVKACSDAGKEAPKAQGYPTQTDVNSALAAGRLDAYMADTPVAVWAVETTDGQFEKVPGDVGVAPYGVAVPKTPAELTTAIQGALQKLMDDGSYKKILDNWGLGDEAITKSEINAAVF